MTLSENAPTSQAAADRDRQSRMEGGPRSGPNKDGASAPSGASAFGNEVGGEADAQRERAAAISQGDRLPSNTDPSSGGAGAGSLGFGQLAGFEKGYGQGPSNADREQNQQDKNQAWKQGGGTFSSF